MTAQHGQVEESHVVTCEVEASGAGEMDERSGCGRKCAMPEVDEFTAAAIAFLGLSKDLFRFEVEEAHAHSAITHDAFEVTDAAASAEALFRIESDGNVAA